MTLLKVFNPKEVKKKEVNGNKEQKKPEKQKWQAIVDFNKILFIVLINF